VRLFQNFGVYRSYLPRLAKLVEGLDSFEASRDVFLGDRFGASHVLLPVLEGHETTFFTNGGDYILQGLWARQQGMPSTSTLADILLAQIEHHRTEVFYNIDPMRYGNEFVRRLPGCVKHAIAWRAAPSSTKDFGAYDRIVCNFPAILAAYRARGWKAEYFTPAHDPEMDSYAANYERPIDILFVGGYSRYHRRRAAILEAVAQLAPKLRVRFHLDRSRMTRLAESPIGWCPPFSQYRRPGAIRRVSAEPVFGRDLYHALSRAKIVLNGAVDMAGDERGNMRCFEAMGCGALMLSDAGRYPEGMQDGTNMVTYRDGAHAVQLATSLLAQPESLQCMAQRGYQSVATIYSKAAQWREFERIVSEI